MIAALDMKDMANPAKETATFEAVLSVIAQNDPDRPAVLWDDQHVSFADLRARVERAAAWMYEHGLRSGDRVGISVAGEYENFLATLALLRLGCLQVTLATLNPAPMRTELAERCSISILVTDDPRWALADLQTVVIDFGRFAGAIEELPVPPPPDPDANALFWASSGTTGRAKLVPSSQRRLISYSARQWLKSGFETSLPATSIQFDITKRRALNALVLGKATILISKTNTVPLHILCQRYSVDLLWLGTHQARTMLDAAAGETHPILPEHTQMLLGGSSSGNSLREDLLRQAGTRLHITYGATESGRISVASLIGEPTEPTDVGVPVRTVEIKIADVDGGPLPRGEIGEICVRAPGMATEYYDDPELTRQRFREVWYHTGDIGRLSSQGRLSIEGRSDDMMILNSVNVFPFEIETVIERFPGVIESAAFPLPSPVHGEIPVAMIRTAGDIDLRALTRHCREHLGLRAPRRLFPVAELPRTPAGKIARNRLADTLDTSRSLGSGAKI